MPIARNILNRGVIRMPERDYVSTPVADDLNLKDVILGLASDLKAMRANEISPQDGLARAAVAKQLFNGVRLYIQAVKTIETNAAPVRAIEE